MMWTEKYRPRSVAEVVGNEAAKQSFLEWLRKWHPGVKPALLCGPPGVGKTTLVHAVAREMNYDLIEMNASDARNEDALMKVAGPAASEASLSKFFIQSKGALVLLDEVDGVYGREDQGGIGAVIEVASTAKAPVILTANDVSDPRLRELRENSVPIRFYPIRPPALTLLLEHVCKQEGLQAEREALEAIALKSQGDVRSALNDLQALAEASKVIHVEDIRALGVRDRQLNYQETLKGIFLANTGKEARMMLQRTDMDFDTLIQALHDNIPHQLKDPQELIDAYEHISKADVFLGRVKTTQNWGLLKYAMDEMTVGVASARKHDYAPVAYRFPPEYILTLSRTRAQRILRDSTAAKTGQLCHVSKRRAIADLIPYLRVIFENDNAQAERIASMLRLSDDEYEFLAGHPRLKPVAQTKPRRHGRKDGAS